MSLHQRLIHLYYRAATSSTSVRTLLTPIGACVFLGFIAILIALSRFIDEKLSLPRLIPRTRM
ncbi:MAG: hypothetical protein P8182_06950 [Deltaproteobacteria bacterium]